MIKIADLSYHDNRKTKTGQLGIRPTVVIGGNTGDIDVNVHANSAYVLKEHIEVSDIKALYDYLVEIYNDDLQSFLAKPDNGDFMDFYPDGFELYVHKDSLIYIPYYDSFDGDYGYVYKNGQWEYGSFDYESEEIISSGANNTDKKYMPIDMYYVRQEGEEAIQVCNSVIEKLKPFIQEEIEITRPVIKQATFKQNYDDYSYRNDFRAAGFQVQDFFGYTLVRFDDLIYSPVIMGSGQVAELPKWKELAYGDPLGHELTDMSKLTIQFNEGMLKQLELLSDENYEDFLNIFETIEYK